MIERDIIKAVIALLIMVLFHNFIYEEEVNSNNNYVVEMKK